MKIKSVTPKWNQRGEWWLIRSDEEGAKAMATSNMFHAALAERARDSQQEVRVLISNGWFYSDLDHIELVHEPTT